MVLPVELLIFDLDGVLVESEIQVAAALCERLAAVDIVADVDLIIRRFHYMPHPLIAETLAAEQGRRVPSAFYHTVHEAYSAALGEHLCAVKGAHDALTRLALPKCIASGSRPEGLRRKLEIVGLLPFFEPHLFSAFEIGKPKPAPDIFLHAARRLGVSPDCCLVIEDAVVGIQAAKAAGMHALGFCGAAHCHEGWAEALTAAGADGILHELGELPAYVAELAA